MRKEFLVIPIIALVLLGGLYYYENSVASSAAIEVQKSISLIDYSMRDYNLNPVSGILAVTCRISNPSALSQSVSLRLEFYVGGNFIATVKANDETIEAGGVRTIEMLTDLDDVAIKTYAERGGFVGAPRLTGVMTTKSRVFLIPISINHSIDLVTAVPK